MKKILLVATLLLALSAPAVAAETAADAGKPAAAPVQKLDRYTQQLVMAAEQGNRKCQLLLGDIFYFGRGVKRDDVEASKWYLMAAKQGDADAQYKIGYNYNYGLGVKQDYSQAMSWYQKAAETAGVPGAELGMGIILATQADPPDYATAYFWLALAADYGGQSATDFRKKIRNKLHINDANAIDKRAAVWHPSAETVAPPPPPAAVPRSAYPKK